MTGKRTIFEEVGAKSPEAAPQGGLIDRGRSGARGAIRAWLVLLFVMVVAMIAVGGLTRLTDSGLSITEWRPVTGALPPMSEAAWQEEFAKYQQIPEYQLQNRGMTLEEFKFIYWWEWGHRQLGRLIGLVWAVGFFGFLAARKIPPGWTGRLLIPGILGGLQGAVGWWMVASGLEGARLDVASYRLATHLGLAFVILGVLAWYVFRLGRPERELMQARRLREEGLMRAAGWLAALAFLQILLGALVAGIDAGRNYIDWPWMAGGFLPPQPFELEPWWRNFFENDGMVQFIHRMVAYLLVLAGLIVWWRARRSPNPATRTAFAWVAVAIFAQMVLGIVTVMHSSPWSIALLHQLGAVAVWVLILRARFMAAYPRAVSVREGL
ncbi:cytochrome c oxidase assembly protein subunit 15 [Meinhardsimonia xiamenensis]|jgi:cytochrome c oxidase assembly protein subunit 15|uniref:Heme A synthase n=1 Tax=Meinhardsimonia xiamenensis TaxID=990712 RepID=A0A1G9FXW3_9RHOB|nr:heme A synthase [Meinhardsimonia xiamenensis]PRX32760.1 cytochrome c oxidase assembly protein subunit 15 [Meinhardsimonia xiamenensis]SDK93230.1 cytochrome c oxidase assembly protein subunit 15 [Meinhardsimonia xiamenensis]